MLACASYVRPGPGPTQSFTRGDEAQFEWLTINLTQAAAENPTKPFAFDDKRRARLVDVLSQQGALVNAESVKNMTDAEACEMTQKQLSAIRAFSESDEAYFVKALYLK